MLIVYVQSNLIISVANELIVGEVQASTKSKANLKIVGECSDHFQPSSEYL